MEEQSNYKKKTRGKRGGKRKTKALQNDQTNQINQINQTLVKVPGNLTCAAHSFFLSLLAVGMTNLSWFHSIFDIVSVFVRRNYDIDGTVSGCQIRTHMLRDLVVETVRLRGENHFATAFGDSWYWGPEVESDILGIIESTKDDPATRGFIEHANPFFMVCSFLFKCKIHVQMDNGLSQTFSPKNLLGPIIKIRSNADSGKGTHFDALIPDNLPEEWSLDLNVFYGSGPKYIFEGNEYSDIILNIDDWYSYLGNRYLDILRKSNQANKAKQIEDDLKFARELSVRLT